PLSSGLFWPDAEFGECRGRFLDRQTNDISVGAVDLCDDLCAVTLRGVRAGIIQRIHFRKVIFDRCDAEAVKTTTRKFMERCWLSGRETINENGGANFVRSSAQAA